MLRFYSLHHSIGYFDFPAHLHRDIMTELVNKPSNVNATKLIKSNDSDEYVCETASDDSASKKSDSSSSCSGSWSINDSDSIEFIQISHKTSFDESPNFPIGTESPQNVGSLPPPVFNEVTSLFNLSISPISSVEDLTRVNDQSVVFCGNFNTTSGKYTEEWTQNIYSIANDYPEDERISLEEIQARINTPPSALSKSNKRLNLETIFEDVFLETPKKKRFNGIKRFNSWRIEAFQEITNEERINSYVFEQQQSKSDLDTTNILCSEFDDKVNI